MRYIPRFTVRSLMILIMVIAGATGLAIAVAKHLGQDVAREAEFRAVEKTLNDWRLYAWHRHQEEVCQQAIKEQSPYDPDRRYAECGAFLKRFPGISGISGTAQNGITSQGGWVLENQTHKYWAERLSGMLIGSQEAPGR